MQIWTVILHWVGGVNLYVYECVFDLLSWPALFLYKSFSFFLFSFFFNFVCSASYRELILKAAFPVKVHRAFLLFSCSTFSPPLNRTYVLCCLFCLFILEGGKVQQGKCQFTGICVLHDPLSALMLEGRLMFEAPTQFSVPRRHSSGVSLSN